MTPDDRQAPVLSDEYLEALINSCPLQGYALMTALPQTLTVDQLRLTLREWARALLQSHIDCEALNSCWREWGSAIAASGGNSK